MIYGYAPTSTDGLSALALPQRPCRPHSPDLGAIPVEERRRDERLEAAEPSSSSKPPKRRDERRDHHLPRASRPVVGLDRKAQSGFGQRGAERALGARLGRRARSEKAHDLCVKTAFSGDRQGMSGDGGANPRRRLSRGRPARGPAPSRGGRSLGQARSAEWRKSGWRSRRAPRRLIARGRAPVMNAIAAATSRCTA